MFTELTKEEIYAALPKKVQRILAPGITSVWYIWFMSSWAHLFICLSSPVMVDGLDIQEQAGAGSLCSHQFPPGVGPHATSPGGV